MSHIKTLSKIYIIIKKHPISHIHCDYTDVGNDALRTSSMADTLTGVTFFGYYIWLQSDAAFYYLRLDKCSFTVGMFCATCDVTRRPLGRLATACSWEGKCVSTRRAGPRGVSLSQVFDGTRSIADI